METVHYAPSPSVSHNGFLYKTGSMARAIAEKKGRDGELIPYTQAERHTCTRRPKDTYTHCTALSVSGK
jgi:hypothetical protein